MIKISKFIVKNYSKPIAIWQNIISEIASIVVVINGLATTAGSSLIFFASSGKQQPISFAIKIVANSASETTNDS